METKQITIPKDGAILTTGGKFVAQNLQINLDEASKNALKSENILKGNSILGVTGSAIPMKVMFDDSLTKVAITAEDFGSGVDYIKEYAFYNVSSITSVVLPSTVTEIGDYAFYGCNVANITLNEGLETIGDRAFMSSALSEVTIPSTVASIGSYALNTNSLHTIKFLGNNPPTAETGVLPTTAIQTIYVPKGRKTRYSVSAYWADFASKMVEYE